MKLNKNQKMIIGGRTFKGEAPDHLIDKNKKLVADYEEKQKSVEEDLKKESEAAKAQQKKVADARQKISANTKKDKKG